MYIEGSNCLACKDPLPPVDWFCQLTDGKVTGLRCRYCYITATEEGWPGELRPWLFRSGGSTPAEALWLWDQPDDYAYPPNSPVWRLIDGDYHLVSKEGEALGFLKSRDTVTMWTPTDADGQHVGGPWSTPFAHGKTAVEFHIGLTGPMPVAG